MDVFSLATDRLIMTPHGLDDFADVDAMFADARVVRHLGGVPFASEENWQRLLRYAGNWALFGCGIWAVRRSDTGAYVGGVGFLQARRTGVAGIGDDPEIGWTLATAAHGHGYATEAVRAALAWGVGRFERTVAMINHENTESEAVAQRCGFRRFGDATYKDAAVSLWDFTWPL